MEPKFCVLLFLLRDDEILLAMKKRGFGKGLWNGPGGKVEAGETIEQAIVRECQEEIDVTPEQLEKVAYNEFYFPDGTADLHVHVFVSRKWQGEPTESEEMRPEWFKQSKIPYEKMWQDDIFWLPAVLLGHNIQGRFVFDDSDNMLDAQLKIMDNIGGIDALDIGNLNGLVKK